MHSTAVNVDREERVRQSASDLDEVNDFRTYVPNGSVVAKLKNWKSQGAEVHYLTSRRTPEEIDDIRFVLQVNGFPDASNLHYRRNEQSYAQVAQELSPDLLIEDDCESIGGEAEMTYPNMDSGSRLNIRSIVVREFEGIDHLSDSLNDLGSPEGSNKGKENK